jgi:transaldolase
MVKLYDKVSGFTTNPSLMRAAGITDYKVFSNGILPITRNKPVSFEVFGDDLVEMERQAREISSWGSNVYVKIPCTLTNGHSTGLLVSKLGKRGVKVNVTAVMTFQQISEMCRFIWVGTPAILSIFCGRIADTGRDPVPFITKALQQKHDKTQILWASTREVLNVKQAEQAGADIITLSPDLIRKLDLFGKDLAQYSLETVKQFHDDGKGIEF